MAIKEHLSVLRQGADSWNNWRKSNHDVRPDFSRAALNEANLSGADLSYANLFRTDLSNTNLRDANLSIANLIEAKLNATDLSGANLYLANLSYADLTSAALGDALLHETAFSNVDLTDTLGLESCRHARPCSVDYRTLMRSKNVPPKFWRGCGLPDPLIDYLQSLTDDAIEFYSCFISYSSKDQEFAERLYADLQNAGVRCWFAPHDLEIGGVIQEDIASEIRSRDKLILILSKASVASGWVTREVKTALEEEQLGRRVLFPVRLDDAVMDTTDQWAHDIKRKRNIGDFTCWQDHDAYKKTFDRILRDLTAKN